MVIAKESTLWGCGVGHPALHKAPQLLASASISQIDSVHMKVPSCTFIKENI